MESKCSRRKFIRKTCAGAAGIGLIGLSKSQRPALAYYPQDAINPNVDNLRVVFVHDDAMTNGTDPLNTWAEQNAATNPAVVETNIDKMACALAEKADVTQAWQAILQKPPGKQWSEVVVALKSNHIARDMQATRDAVMRKMCTVLIDHIGVTPSNIHIYDGIHGGYMTYTPFNVPAGVVIEQRWGGLGPTIPIPEPEPGTTRAVTSVANGTVDILVNMSLCKGHNSNFGNFTQCLKNNYGTCQPSCTISSVNPTDYLFAINKSETIVGAMDPGTGRIIFPRQQICLMDALWASHGGPTVVPSCRPNRLFMGTFAPAVDYQVATRFRRDTMGWSLVQSVVDRFLTEFGYPADALTGVEMVDALTWGPPQSLAVDWWKEY